MSGPHDIDFLARVPEVDAVFDVSPDGARVAFVWNKTGRNELYLLDLTTRAITQLTQHGKGASSPAFSPMGSQLLFAQDHDGDERWDYHLLDLSTGAARCVWEQDAAGYAPARWLPQGDAFVAVYAIAGRMTLCRIDATTGAATPLTRHAYQDNAAAVSRDGTWVAFDAHTTGQERGGFVMRADGSDLRALPVNDAAHLRFSPDGTRIAFQSMRESEDIGVFDVRSGVVRWLAAGQWDETQPEWSPDGSRLLYILNDDGAHSVQVMDAASGEGVARIAPEDGVVESAQFARVGASVVFTFSNHRTPASLWEYDFASQRCAPLTPGIEAEVDRDAFSQPHFVRYASHDGLSVPALVYPSRAPGKDAGAIVLIHGGPTWAYTNFWHVAPQHFAQMGYTVLCPNYRGSTGYGRVYQNLNRYDLGRGDVLDCVAGADWLVREGLASAARLGVTGASQGGYMTMMCLAKHAQYWAAGSSLIGYFNWFTEFATEREDLRYWDLQNMGDPATPEGEARFRDRSPVFFLDGVRAPVQLIAGRADPRCPAAETEQVHDALVKRGVPVELTVYEDEGHGFAKVENKIDAYRKRAAFFTKHLHHEGTKARS
jgi:dipeptidyl aminopeptidase/acylaminoacyl peptidase